MVSEQVFSCIMIFGTYEAFQTRTQKYKSLKNDSISIRTETCKFVIFIIGLIHAIAY